MIFNFNLRKLKIKEMSKQTEIELTTADTFKLSNLEFGTPEAADIKDNTGKSSGAQYYKCSISYNGGQFAMEAPEQTCYGVQEEYAFGKAKTPENFKGHHLCYYCSEKKDVEMSPIEKKFVTILRSIETKLSNHLKNNADYLTEKQASLASQGKLLSAIARYPKKEVPSNNPKNKQPRKVDDKEKPLRFYVRMIVSKNGKFVTRFYGPNDRELNPLTECFDTKGLIQPVIKFEYVYIGEGSATVQLKLYECNFTPLVSSNRKRLIGKNEHSESMQDSETPQENQDVKPSEKFDPNESLEGGDDFEEPLIEESSLREKPKPVVKKVVKRIVKKKE